MPIYEYSCRKCGQSIEVIQKISDPDLKKHAACGGTLEKLLSVPTVQFKSSAAGHASKHLSVMQQRENEAKRKEKLNKPRRIINAPTGSKSRRGI
jgi:putative FmdB family regulatory protein